MTIEHALDASPGLWCALNLLLEEYNLVRRRMGGEPYVLLSASDVPSSVGRGSPVTQGKAAI